MEWMVVNPLIIHSTFSSLGVQVGESYIVSSDCHSTLDEILKKLTSEDRSLRTFRRAISCSQVIKHDLIPLLINAKDAKIIDAVVRIFVNLTIPIECLLPMEAMSKTEAGRQMIFELNKLLLMGKEAFVDLRCTRIIIDHIKNVTEKNEKLSSDECESVNNCLLLLRNILHIPETRNCNSSGQHYSMQNQILWNLFAQSLDKILIHLMTCAQKAYWGVTMVQLIALMYKDQHVGTLQKLLNLWVEASLSESSEDNESNTSPPDQGSGDSSPMVTSDPTSDSSDNGCSSQDQRLTMHCGNKTEKYDVEFKSAVDPPLASTMGNKQNSGRTGSSPSDSGKSSGKGSTDSKHKPQQTGGSTRKNPAAKNNCKKERIDGDVSSVPHHPHFPGKTIMTHNYHVQRGWPSSGDGNIKMECPSSSEISDCGYGTQVENQESVSSSSNEEMQMHAKRPQKPHMIQKPRFNTKPNLLQQDKKEWRRKKLVKRSKTNSMNMKALMHHTPTDEDVSNLLKEFTVDFLLKGYGCLVKELHSQLLYNNYSHQVDTSHFFWLVTYFLKFAAQLELDLEHIYPVLSFDVVSYLTYEGVNLCEELEIGSQLQGSDLKPCVRRMHLVVTAIREFIQAIVTYQKVSHLSVKDREHILQLQLKIGSTEDLRSLLVLLLRQYNPSLQNKQYLEDLIVTNHILLLFLDNVIKLPQYTGTTNMMEHIRQFATVEVIHQYGLLLEDFQSNGEFINDCVFTMMHHIGGDIEQSAVLFQPIILKTFSQMWEMDFEVCDDWSDLIEYVIHKFVNVPRQLTTVKCEDQKQESSIIDEKEHGWLKDECENLYWYYIQSNKTSDPVGKVQELYAENGGVSKSRMGIIEQLLSQEVISQNQYDKLIKNESTDQSEENNNMNISEPIDIGVNDTEDVVHDEKMDESVERTSLLLKHLLKEKKGTMILWLQRVLIEACYVKLKLEHIPRSESLFIMEPIPYHYTVRKQSIPIVPWNLEQKSFMLYQPFILLLHKLGFHLPSDTGKVFVRIPNFWTADVLYNIAEKLGPINKISLKFDLNLLQREDAMSVKWSLPPVPESPPLQNNFAVPHAKHASSIIRSSPLPPCSMSPLELIMRSKMTSIIIPPRSPSPPCFSISPVVTDDTTVPTEDCETVHDHVSVGNVSDGADSVASDLTRMYVSDEDERLASIPKACPLPT